MVTNIRHLHPFYSNSLRACSANNGVLITFHSTTSFTTTFRKEGYSAAITSSNILYCPLSTYLSISLSTRMLGIIPMLSSLGLRAPSLSHNPNPILFFFGCGKEAKYWSLNWGTMLTRQAFYHLSHVSDLFLLFFKSVMHFFSGPALNCNLSYLCRITDVYNDNQIVY
jgi:hypothetical protein